MLILSKQNLEEIGGSVLRDYSKRIHLPVDIEGFAQRYLGLRIEYRKLSDHGHILGLTSYKGVVVELHFKAGNQYITVPEDTILLDERLESKSELHRRRFTIAHECAHQILTRMEERIIKTHSYRELVTAGDWSEWQANVLAAALLIPSAELTAALNWWRMPFKPTLYGNRFNTMEYRQIKHLTQKFCVSIAAMVIRLKELGSIIIKSALEYHDPQEIVCE
jgi:hypothetical protein